MILAITGRYEKDDRNKYFSESICYNKYFRDIFEKIDVLLFPVASTTKLEDVVNICDGLIVTGRVIDINPKYYGEEAIEETNLCSDYDKEDELDFNLINAFYEANKPILGICAGIQSINVCFGGSLCQDIKNHKKKEEVKMHPIYIEEATFLEKCYNTNKIEVNSFHHQAINRLAENFKIAATSEDGIVEAIECGNILGVQWHPEQMMDMKFFKTWVDLYF